MQVPGGAIEVCRAHRPQTPVKKPRLKSRRIAPPAAARVEGFPTNGSLPEGNSLSPAEIGMQRHGEMCKVLHTCQSQMEPIRLNQRRRSKRRQHRYPLLLLASHLHLVSSEMQGLLGFARGAIEYGCVLRCNPNNLVDDLR